MSDSQDPAMSVRKVLVYSDKHHFPYLTQIAKSLSVSCLKSESKLGVPFFTGHLSEGMLMVKRRRYARRF